MINRNISRRGLLAGLAITGLAGADQAGFPFISRGLANAPIRIAVGACPNAVSIHDARGVRFGADMALRQAGGKVLGQPVQLVHFEETDHNTITADFRKLTSDHGIVGVIGGSTDLAAVTLQNLVSSAQMPLIVHSATLDELTIGQCSRWSYRVPAPVGIQLRAVRPYVAEYAKRWFILSTADPSGRRGSIQARATIREGGLTEAGTAIVDNGTTDYRAVIEMIRGSEAEAVIGTLASADVARFLKAWYAAGMKDKVLFAQVGVSDADIWAAGPQAATGIYAKTYHFRNPKNPPEVKDFIAAYGRQFAGEVPANTAFQAHAAMQALLSAIGRSGTIDPQHVVNGLDQLGSRFGDMTLRFRASDHQMMHRIPILETKTKIRTRYDFWDVEAFAPEKLADLERFYDSAGTATCGPRNA